MSSISSSTQSSTPYTTPTTTEAKLNTIIEVSKTCGWTIQQFKFKHPGIIYNLLRLLSSFKNQKDYFNDYSVAMTPDLSLGRFTVSEEIREKKKQEARLTNIIYYKLYLIRSNPGENLAAIAEALLLIAQNDCVNPYKQYDKVIDAFLSVFTFK